MSQFIFVPSFIAKRTDIDMSEKYLFGLIAGLADDNGTYCSATNKELAEKMQYSDRGMRKILEKLVTMGLVVRDFNGPNNTRRLMVWAGATKPYTPLPPQPPLDELYTIKDESVREELQCQGGTPVPGWHSSSPPNNNKDIKYINDNSVKYVKDNNVKYVITDNMENKEEGSMVQAPMVHSTNVPLPPGQVYKETKKLSTGTKRKVVNEPSPYADIAYLKEMKPDEVDRISTEYNISIDTVELEAKKALNWLEGNGKKQKSYKQFFNNWIINAITWAKDRGRTLPIRSEKKVVPNGIPADIQERLDTIDWSEKEEENW